MASQRLRNWCFTAYKDPSAIDWNNERTVRYIVFQREQCPETQRIHWQGYVEFTVPYRMAAVKDRFNDRTLHLEARRGGR